MINTNTKDLFDKINAISTIAYDASDEQDLFAACLEQTVELFDAQRGSIFLMDEKTKKLTLKTAFGMNTSEKERMVESMGFEVMGRVTELKKPLRVEDIAKDSRFKDRKPAQNYRTPSFICAPLMIKDHLIGVINIADKSSGKHFTEQDMEILDFLSNQIALNYQRVHLNQNLHNVLKESQTLKKQVVLHERLASIGKLAGGIAHEFNNPLDGVMRYTNLAIDHLHEDDVVVKEYLLEVRQGLKRMANIVKNLLACARNTSPGAQKADVNKCIEQTIKEFHSRLFQKNIKVEKHLDKNLPEVPDLGIERILSNLMSNAIDAVNEYGTITIRTSIDGSYAKIVFADTGKGISKENMDNIFEPFFTTKNIDQGCGLGLTIVNEIVKYSKGKIELESAPKKGTTFTIRLPIESTP